LDERYRCEPLGKQHLRLRAAFSCGTNALDQYLRERARKEVDQRVAAVRVLYDSEEDRLAGYYTLSAVVVERTDLPTEITHRLARYRVYPATLIGRLAVDQGYQGERLGGRLLIDALARSLDTSRDVASMAVITDAKDDEARSFYEHYGFRPLPTESYGRRLFLPMKTVEQLFAGR
jgi:GNAT superfamily N-acetyltransferase